MLLLNIVKFCLFENIICLGIAIYVCRKIDLLKKKGENAKKIDLKRYFCIEITK